MHPLVQTASRLERSTLLNSPSMTTYSELAATDTDVAAFLAARADRWLPFPTQMWVAREDGRIVALLMLSTFQYVALHLVCAPTAKRPFMRIYKLLRLAEGWLAANRIPIVCAP